MGHVIPTGAALVFSFTAQVIFVQYFGLKNTQVGVVHSFFIGNGIILVME